MTLDLLAYTFDWTPRVLLTETCVQCGKMANNGVEYTGFSRQNPGETLMLLRCKRKKKKLTKLACLPPAYDKGQSDKGRCNKVLIYSVVVTFRTG